MSTHMDNKNVDLIVIMTSCCDYFKNRNIRDGELT